jgi:hypothetical protein
VQTNEEVAIKLVNSRKANLFRWYLLRYTWSVKLLSFDERSAIVLSIKGCSLIAYPVCMKNVQNLVGDFNLLNHNAPCNFGYEQTPEWEKGTREAEFTYFGKRQRAPKQTLS